MIRAHVFTTAGKQIFLKQSPNMSPELDGVRFTFGIEVPADCDVLIVHTRASFAIPVKLPRERTVFVAGEPDVIHPYNPKFLNQFGLVLTTSPKALETRKLHENYCAPWFAGMDFVNHRTPDDLKGLDWFRSLQIPEKQNRISIITSGKTHTEYHRKRLAFVAMLSEQMSELIDFYGFGHNIVGDKKDALLGYRYHIALENGTGDYTWTEKLSDPLLCWTFPFHAGCENISEDLPAESFAKIDLDDPQGSITRIREAVEADQWSNSLEAIAEARQSIMGRFNLMYLFVRLAKEAIYAMPKLPERCPSNLIYSERSYPPGPGERGSWVGATVRRSALLIDPNIELRIARLRFRKDALKAAWRARRGSRIPE
jgi:hypothetical protein